MKHNHPQVHSALNTLRSEIDSIDDCILDLLEQRYAVTQRVSVAKTMASSDALPIRPQREQAILKRLATKAVNVPSDDIAHIWRSILTLSARAQKAYRVILWSPEDTRFALAALAASRFGSAVPIEWAESAKKAVEVAQAGDAILLMPSDLIQPSKMAELELIGQYPLACIHHPWAAAMGKLDGEALVASPQPDLPTPSGEEWEPASWRGYVHHQLPAYRDADALRSVESRLALAAPVVKAKHIAALTAEVAQGQEGRRLVIQAGDCAEAIDATRDDTTAMGALVHGLADTLERTGRPVTRLGRLAGQFGKPRSASAEKADGATIAVYRGDAVNRPGASTSERAADPERLHEAYAQSCRAAAWLDEQALARIEPGELFTSHEALLLNYEAALTRRGDDGRWYALSAHSLWLGDRTRDPRGAHVEYLRGIANPIGIKCGPSIEPNQLVELLERLNPGRKPGRIMLVARLGHEKVGERLGPLMEAVRDEGHPALWICDPMHGNNRTIEGTKTRFVAEIITELRQYVAIARSTGIHPGGLHLEVTPSSVLECVDDPAQAYAPRCYQSRCDPRLNAQQAMEVVQNFADAVGQVL